MEEGEQRVSEAPRRAVGAAQYRKSLEYEVVLPTGPIVTVRRCSLMDWAYSGAIPTPLLEMILKARKGEISMAAMDETVKSQQEFNDLLDALVSRYVVAPKIVHPIRNEDGSTTLPLLQEDEIGTWEMLDRDKMHVYQLALADTGLGPETESLFRQLSTQHGPSDAPAPNREDVRTEAERLVGSGQVFDVVGAPV